jgi:N-acetylmuramoyl-L-alanine amidase
VPHRAHAAATVPDTLVALAGPDERAGSPSFPIGYIGVTWAGGGECGVRLRTAAGWSDWQSMPHGDAAEGERCLSLVPANGALAYEVQTPAGATDVRIVAINTTDGPRRRAAAPASVGLSISIEVRLGGFRYLPRAGWGADESHRFGQDGKEVFPPEYFPVQALTVHHTATTNDDPDPAATVRAIYFFHAVTQAWGDIGYHLLIDEAGTVYEGRWSGDDPVPVFGGPPQDKPQMSNGSHVGGFNAGNIGVALLGDLTAGGPTQAARDSLVEVLAALAAETGLDPLAEVDYVNPINGSTRRVPVISGHRDWAATACPGDTFHPTLPGLRSDVAARLGQRSTAL